MTSQPRHKCPHSLPGQHVSEAAPSCFPPNFQSSKPVGSGLTMSMRRSWEDTLCGKLHRGRGIDSGITIQRGEMLTQSGVGAGSLPRQLWGLTGSLQACVCSLVKEDNKIWPQQYPED